MASPEVIEPIIQKDEGDCAVASVAMLLNLSYREVSEAALKKFKSRPHTHGLSLRQIKSLMKHFGHDTKSIHPNDVEMNEETGIVSISKPENGHAAVIFNGIIIDPSDGLLYTPDAYLAYKKGKITRLLRI